MRKIFEQINTIIDSNKYWTLNLGLARSLIALCTLLSLLFNNTETLFFFEQKLEDDSLGFSIFSLFDHQGVAIFLSCLILVWVISGYLPKYSAIPHWWVTFSYWDTVSIIEGGDQIAAILTLLMIPVLLCDNRLNHWSTTSPNAGYYSKTISFFSYLIIYLQVSFLYLQAAIGKMFVAEWIDGTAVYYWVYDTNFGMNDSLLELFSFAFKSSVMITLMTWGTLLIEMLLGVAILISNQFVRKIIFLSGISLHLLIGFTFGLWSFSLAMVGILIIYFYGQNFDFLWYRTLSKSPIRFLKKSTAKYKLAVDGQEV